MGGWGSHFVFICHAAIIHSLRCRTSLFRHPEWHWWDWRGMEALPPLPGTAPSWGSSSQHSSQMVVPGAGHWQATVVRHQQQEASFLASNIWAAQFYFRTACALTQWQTSTSRQAKRARKCSPIPCFQCCKGAGLLNSGFCFERLPQNVCFQNQRAQP